MKTFFDIRGPSKSALIRKTPKMLVDITSACQELAAEHGDIARLTFLGKKILLLSAPRHAKQIFTDLETFSQGDLADDLREHLLGTTLFTTNGEDWRRLRSLLQPLFKKSRIVNLASDMKLITTQWAEKLPHEQTVDVGALMYSLSSKIIARVLFGSKSYCLLDDATVRLVMTAVSRTLIAVGVSQALPTRLESDFLIRLINGYHVGVMRHRIVELVSKAPQEEDSLITVMQKAGLSEELQADQVVALILAGVVTTASALTWFWLRMEENLQCEQLWHKELDAVPDDDEIFSSDSTHLTYTNAAFQETNRLHPAVGIVSRSTARDVIIDDYLIPAGIDVWFSTPALSQNPQHWSDPQLFKPERFLAGAKIDPYEYLPFLVGPRMCIGRHLANLEARVVLSLIGKRVTFRSVASPKDRLRIKKPNLAGEAKNRFMMVRQR